MLLQLYRDLVITQVISSEEFWSQHAAEYTQAKKTKHQEIGVNSAFLVSPPPPLCYDQDKRVGLAVTYIDAKRNDR